MLTMQDSAQGRQEIRKINKEGTTQENVQKV